MTVYVDWLVDNGWKLGRNCHMMTDDLDTFADLHAMALRIGMRPHWFQMDVILPHYDLTEGKRRRAIAAGAIAIDNRACWREVIMPIKRAWGERMRVPAPLPPKETTT